ncbi:universal stress protein [Caldovatus aquaticus]|uniref:Universal stress protein n=1 Tax=Caldovatus aquaticus TaxID=2865671 RepID=A0ABS7EYQ6_9PROT|nr:universal stress protein [Caldovatus aquaticus]MBW8268424.1 universal stress protein [Caldovatus aquaticus]
MIRSLLLALDDTPGALAARGLAIALARRCGAALTAAVVLDRPHAADEHEPVPLGASAFKLRCDAARLRRAEAEAERALAEFAAAAGDLAFEALRLEDAPEEALLRAEPAHDLVVIGRDSTLGFEETENGVAPAIEVLLRDGARPLLVVPPGAQADLAGSVLVGYDGSRPAMRALQLFALLGLCAAGPARVVSLADEPAEAARRAEEAARFLHRHGFRAEPCGLAGDAPAERLLAEAGALPAGLMVLGAFGHAGLLRSLLLGSTTRRLLQDSPCPLFLHH